jgi:hypothetical protein
MPRIKSLNFALNDSNKLKNKKNIIVQSCNISLFCSKEEG